MVQILGAWSADHFNARGFHTAAFALMGAVGFMASNLLPPDAYASRYGCLIVAAAGSFAAIPPMLGWLTSNVYSTASVGLAVALNVGFGAGIGQMPGIWIYKAEEAKAGYPTGHWVVSDLPCPGRSRESKTLTTESCVECWHAVLCYRVGHLLTSFLWAQEQAASPGQSWTAGEAVQALGC